MKSNAVIALEAEIEASEFCVADFEKEVFALRTKIMDKRKEIRRLKKELRTLSERKLEKGEIE